MNPMLELDVTDDVLTQLESRPTPLRSQDRQRCLNLFFVGAHFTLRQKITLAQIAKAQ